MDGGGGDDKANVVGAEVLVWNYIGMRENRWMKWGETAI